MPYFRYDDYAALVTELKNKRRTVTKRNKKIKKLEKENEELKTEYEKECHRADELEDSYWKAEKENQKLKELLKECESSIQYYQETYGAMDLDTYTLLAKLNEVLK